VAEGAGLPCVALITDMNQVLGRCAGNALEVGEAIAFLTGAARDPRLHEVVMALGAEMLVLGGLAPGPVAARGRLEAVLDSGAAAERFARMVESLGGPPDLIEDPGKHLPAAPVVRPALPEQPGVVAAMDLRRIGLAVVQLGGGRRDAADRIDHGVGLAEVAGLGDAVGPERPLALVHARSREAAEAAERTIRDAITLGDTAAPETRLIHRRLAGPGR
jgi:thymidine phosphorylase